MGWWCPECRGVVNTKSVYFIIKCPHCGCMFKVYRERTSKENQKREMDDYAQGFNDGVSEALKDLTVEDVKA